MDLYGQDAEAYLLSRLMQHLDRCVVIDVGSERGSLVEELLQAGAEELHAFEPHPDNVEALRERFDTEVRVAIHEYAIGDRDGNGELHVSTNPDGSPLPFGHTLLERTDTDEITWRQTVSVTLRSLQSLIDAGEIPSAVGILKIDTEGHDLAVVQGMGVLEADVVMVEHWTDLPHGLGRCPWTAQDMLAELEPRGFSHFAFIVHRGELTTLKWDDAEVERGAMGNLLFFHERVFGRVLPDVLECAGRLTEQTVRVGQEYMRVASERAALIGQLKQALDDRLALVEELHQVAAERLRALEAARAQLQSTETQSTRAGRDQ